MATGFSYAGICYETEQSATEAYFAPIPLSNTSSATHPTYQTCEIITLDKTTQFLEGMELGWAVAGVMLVVFVIRRIYRG